MSDCAHGPTARYQQQTTTVQHRIKIILDAPRAFGVHAARLRHSAKSDMSPEAIMRGVRGAGEHRQQLSDHGLLPRAAFFLPRRRRGLLIFLEGETWCN